jgi:hypothetical protein
MCALDLAILHSYFPNYEYFRQIFAIGAWGDFRYYVAPTDDYHSGRTADKIY